jgi:hypothetical protein
VEALCVTLEEDQCLALLLPLHPLLLTLPLAEFFDGLAEQGLTVVVRPLFHQCCAQIALLPVHHVIAQHAHARLAVPPAFLLCEHHWQSVGFEDRADHWHEARKVLIEEFEVADEGQQLVDAGPEYFDPGEDEVLVDGAGLGGVEEREV